MKVFLIQGVDHYINLINQQVTYKDLKDHPLNEALIKQKASIAGACCSSRREIMSNLNNDFESLAIKITTEDTEIADKLIEVCNCEELVFACYDDRKNVKQEISYERKDART